MIEICNSNIYCKVWYQGALSQQIEMQFEIKQGDAMSSILFNLAFKKVIGVISEDHIMELNKKI